MSREAKRDIVRIQMSTSDKELLTELATKSQLNKGQYVRFLIVQAAIAADLHKKE